MFLNKQISSRLSKIEKTLDNQNEVLFESWDTSTGSRRPGIVERVEKLSFKMDRFQSFSTKSVIWAIGPMLTILTLKALGVPVQDIVPTTAKIVLGFMH
jgi:hypothetical protein